MFLFEFVWSIELWTEVGFKYNAIIKKKIGTFV